MTETTTRRHAVARLAGIATAWAAPSTWGQTQSTARIVLGSGPGSGIDLLARKVAEKLQPGYAGSVLVENKTGASGQLAVMAVKAAPADGSTILVVPTPYMAIYPHTYRNLPYRPEEDFAPVSVGATFALAFGVGPMVPESVKNLKDFSNWCRDNPSRANFGSPAAGSTPHFAGAMLSRSGQFDLQHVAYRGPTPAVIDMIGGQIAAACTAVGDLRSFAADGRCRLLGTTGARRDRFVPEVPTFVEQGYKDLVIEDWYGFFLPAKTPAAQVERASTAIQAAIASREVQTAMEQNGATAKGSSPQAFAALVKSDTQHWAPIVRAIGFTAES